MLSLKVQIQAYHGGEENAEEIGEQAQDEDRKTLESPDDTGDEQPQGDRDQSLAPGIG